MMENYTQKQLDDLMDSKYNIDVIEQIQNIANYNTANRFILNTKCKPATKEHLKEWSSWTFSPNAYQKALDDERKIKDEWRNERWNPLKEEIFLASSFEPNKQKYMATSRYKAYILYGKEQHKLLYNYEKSKSNDDVDLILKHINQHGQFIKNVPVKEILDEDEEIETPKVIVSGRRTKRRAKNEQLKIESMYDELLYKPIDEDEEDEE